MPIIQTFEDVEWQCFGLKHGYWIQLWTLFLNVQPQLNVHYLHHLRAGGHSHLSFLAHILLGVQHTAFHSPQGAGSTFCASEPFVWTKENPKSPKPDLSISTKTAVISFRYTHRQCKRALPRLFEFESLKDAYKGNPEEKSILFIKYANLDRGECVCGCV